MVRANVVVVANVVAANIVAAAKVVAANVVAIRKLNLEKNNCNNIWIEKL